jgi:hypothetical protein
MGCLLDCFRSHGEIHSVIGLERVGCAILDIANSDDRQRVAYTGLNELPERVQAGDLFVGFFQGGDVEFIVENYVSDVAENFAQDSFSFNTGLGRFGARATDVKFYHCSIRGGMPVGGVGIGVLGRTVEEGIKEVAILEGIGVSRSGCILIETLRRAQGNLEHVSVILIHFCVWKRANVEKSCLGERKKTFLIFSLEN